MIRKFIILVMLVASCQGLAQELELVYQVRLIKKLLPNATRFGLMYNPDRANIQSDIEKVTNETGMLVVTSPVSSMREIGGAVRSLIQYDVDFVYLVEDKLLTSRNGLRFVIRPTQRKGIPVFSMTGEGLDNGMFGQIFQDSGYWRMYVNSEALSSFQISVPEGSEDYIPR